jgi:EAL domain-containing protein (putative c-di-GMP-specific phosphodiesterase class I)
MSVNACPEAVQDARFGQALRTSGAPLERLVIEVTEHVRIDDYDAVRQVLDPLRADGARLAVDDTGAGFSSMTHVIRLRPDIIKLDRSLVNGVGEDPARKTLVTAMTLLAIDLGATVTAEGVETVGELEAVAALGVDHAQGYLIGMPADLDPTWARQDFLAGHGVELPAR